MSEPNTPAEGLEELLSLEEKINQTIQLLKTTRTQKEELTRENSRLRSELEAQARTARALEDRVGRLEKERAAVRARVQRLLEQVDSLTATRAEA